MSSSAHAFETAAIISLGAGSGAPLPTSVITTWEPEYFAASAHENARSGLSLGTKLAFPIQPTVRPGSTTMYEVGMGSMRMRATTGAAWICAVESQYASR